MRISVASNGREGGELAAEDIDALELLRVVEQLVAAGGGGEEVDGGKDALVGEAAVEVQLHIAGALVFLEDQVVHAAVRLDERGGEDGEAAAFLGIARGAEEFLRLDQRLGIDAAGHGAPSLPCRLL